MDFPFPVIDRQADYLVRFDQRLRRKLLADIDSELIEEHRRKPLGQHSDRLERLLNYFRRGGLGGKIGILRHEAGVERYRLVRFCGLRGQSSTALNGPHLSCLADAYHAAFLQRVADLQAACAGDEK